MGTPNSSPDSQCSVHFWYTNEPIGSVTSNTALIEHFHKVSIVESILLFYCSLLLVKWHLAVFNTDCVSFFFFFFASLLLTFCSRYSFTNTNDSNSGWGGFYCKYVLILNPLWYFVFPFSALSTFLLKMSLGMDRR